MSKVLCITYGIFALLLGANCLHASGVLPNRAWAVNTPFGTLGIAEYDLENAHAQISANASFISPGVPHTARYVTEVYAGSNLFCFSRRLGFVVAIACAGPCIVVALLVALRTLSPRSRSEKAAT